MIILENLQIEMIFVITEKGEKHGWGPSGSKTVIKAIKVDPSGDLVIGVCFEVPYSTKYHDLDGMVKFGHGYWLTSIQLLSESSFILLQENIVLNPNTKLGERDISNKKGRILRYLSNPKYIMIELLENVKGCSGDGLGKAGHCIILEKDKINFKHKEINKYKEKENKS